MLRGELAPGTWLRQDELARDLGVSKIPVREALQRLAGIGLLSFETNRGAVTSELSMDGADENFSLRRSIEPELLRRAIPNMTIVQLAEAELALDDESIESNWQFHRALYAASGWSRGIAIVEVLHAAVASYVQLYTDHLGGQQDSDDEHRALLDACRSGDADAACDLLHEHLDHAARALLGFLSDEIQPAEPATPAPPSIT